MCIYSIYGAETPVLRSPNWKNQVIGKEFDAGKDWGQKRVTEDEMVEYHDWLKGHKFEQTPGDSEA